MEFNQNRNIRKYPNYQQSNSQTKRVINSMASRLPSYNQHHPNPVETLSLEDINYLQAYLEQLKKSKDVIDNRALQYQTATRKQFEETNIQQDNYLKDIKTSGYPSQYQTLDRSLDVNTRGGYSRDVSRPRCLPGSDQYYNRTGCTNRATEIYNPLNREVLVDWRSVSNKQRVPLYDPEQSAIEPGSRGAICTRTGKKMPELDFSNTREYHNPYEYGAKQNLLPPNKLETYIGPYDSDSKIMTDMGLSGNMYLEKFPGEIRNVNVESSLLQREMTHLPGQRELTSKEIDRFNLLPFDPQDHRHIVWTDNMPRGGYPTRNDRLELA